VFAAFLPQETYLSKLRSKLRVRLRAGLSWALGRASGWLARRLHQAARRLEAVELAALPAIPELLPEDLILEVEPPPIPAAARRRPTPIKRSASEEERAWQELMNGRHPALLTRRLSPPGLSDTTATHAQA